MNHPACLNTKLPVIFASNIQHRQFSLSQNLGDLGDLGDLGGVEFCFTYMCEIAQCLYANCEYYDGSEPHNIDVPLMLAI